MAAPYVIAMPPNMELSPGYQVRVNCIDASSGAAITGCTVEDFAIFGTPGEGSTGEGLQTGPFMLVPGPGA